MSEISEQGQNIPLDVDPADPELARKTYQVVIQLTNQVAALRQRVAELEDKVNT
jgi:hypothetical protein